MSYINKIKDVEIALPRIRAGGLGGEFMMEFFQGVEFPKGSGNVFEIMGTRRCGMPWGGNIITDVGLNYYGDDANPNGMRYCHVGRSSATPTAADTGLGDWVAFASPVGNIVVTGQGAAPWFGAMTYKYRFTPPGSNINLNEVGIGDLNTNSGLSSRALTVNGVGAPTTIQWLANEYLDVYAKRRNYPAHVVEATGAPTDDTGTIDISGTDYGYTIRPIFVADGGNELVGTGDGWGTGMNQKLEPRVGFSTETSLQAIAGASGCTLGAVTSTLSAYFGGLQANTDSGMGSYTTDTFTRELWYQWGIDNANGDIGGIVIKSSLGAYQLVFDTDLEKFEGEAFTWYHDFSWARKNTWV